MADRRPLVLYGSEIKGLASSDRAAQSLFSRLCDVPGTSGSQSLSNSTWTKVTTCLTVSAIGALASNWSSANQRYTATEAGPHILVGYAGTTKSNPTSEFLIEFRQYNSSNVLVDSVRGDRTATYNSFDYGSATFVASVNDYFELWAYVSDATTVVDSAYFQVCR